MKKLKLLSMTLLCISLLQANSENSSRGSIVTEDNKTVAYNTAGGERIFPFHSTLSPALGYVSSITGGKRGVEQASEASLALGYDVHLNVNLELQQKIESILDQAKLKADADHVIAAVMESKTGKVLSMVSSNRYDPGNIRQIDVSSIPLRFTEYPYEPGTVMSPFTLAIAQEHHLVSPDTVFNIFNGKMEYTQGKYIRDRKEFDALSASNVIVESSTIGSAQISWLLSGSEFKEGLVKFGFGEPSGIEFSHDLPGTLKPLHKFEQKLSRAGNSFGYGMLITFTKLLKAYNVFNNDGISVNPYIINYTMDEEEKSYLFKLEPKQVICQKTSEQLHYAHRGLCQ